MKVNNEERIATLKESQYKEIFGVTKTTFDTMLKVLEKANAEERLKGGKRATKITILDRLVITLGYWREYRAYKNIAFDYSVCKAEIGKQILWVEDRLVECGLFSLPSKRELERNQRGREVVAVDVTEQEIERPKKGRKNGIQERKNGTQSKL